MATSTAIESHQLLLIKDGVVHELNVETKNIVTADSFIRALSQSQQVTTPLLPDGCIAYVGRQNGETEYWMLRPPTVWSVGFQQGLTPYSNTLFGVLVPWQLYRVRVLTNIPTRIAMFMMKKRPVSMDEGVFRSYLLNQHDNAECCIHQDLLSECAIRDVPLVNRINRLVQRVSASNFNDDLLGWRSGRPASVMAIPTAGLPDIAPGNTDGGVWCRRLAMWTTNKLATNESPIKLAEDMDLVPLSTFSQLISSTQ